MVYSHTIGLSTMEGRGFYYPVDTVCHSDGKLYTISRSLEGDVRGVRVTIYDIDSEYYGTFSEFGEGARPVHLARCDHAELPGARLHQRRGQERRDRIRHVRHHQSTTGERQAARPDSWTGQPASLSMRTTVCTSPTSTTIACRCSPPEGEFVASYGSHGSGEGQFGLPWGLTVGPDGFLYVADWQNDRVQKLSLDGEYIRSFGRSGRGDGELHRPSGVAVDPEGYVYVSDWGNERVVIFDADGGLVQNIRGEATDSKWAEAFLSINLEEAGRSGARQHGA